MNEYAKLKELAEALEGATSRYMDDETNNKLGDEWSLANDRYVDASSPAVALGLIAENERLTVAAKYCEQIEATPENQRETMLYDLAVERDELKAEIDEDKLHFSAMGRALEGVVAERDRLEAQLFEESMMSECMRQFRADMIELGVVGESCPPTMMTEGVCGYIGKLKAECEGLRTNAGRMVAHGRNQALDEASTLCSRMAYDAYHPNADQYKFRTTKLQRALGGILIAACNRIAELPDGPYQRHLERQAKKAASKGEQS
jgi:hypothetical protein